MSPKEIHKETGKPFFWGRLTGAEEDERDRLLPGMYAAPIAGPSGHVPSPRGGHGGAHGPGIFLPSLAELDPLKKCVWEGEVGAKRKSAIESLTPPRSATLSAVQVAP